jgi:hypothetical protein
MGSDVRGPSHHAVGIAFGIPGEECPDHHLEPGQIASQCRKEAVGGLSRGLRAGLPIICTSIDSAQSVGMNARQRGSSGVDDAVFQATTRK